MLVGSGMYGSGDMKRQDASVAKRIQRGKKHDVGVEVVATFSLPPQTDRKLIAELFRYALRNE